MDRSFIKKLRRLVDRERCLTSPEEVLVYGLDAGPVRSRPEAVVLPETTTEVAEILKLATRERVPVTPRGAGSGLTGGAVPVKGGLVLSLDRMNRILEIDSPNLLAVVQPNATAAELNREAQKHGLFFGPDPASMSFSALGGNIAENAGGMRAVKYGVTKHSVLGLEVVLPSGEVIRTGSKCVKDVVGYGLTELFVGSEGSLGVITEAILKLIPRPQARGLLAGYFRNMDRAAEAVPAILRAGLAPSALEFLDRYCLEALRNAFEHQPPSQAEALLLVEVDGRAEEIPRKIELVEELFREHGATGLRTARDEPGQEALWAMRRSIHGAMESISTHWLEEDISVPVGRIPRMLRKLEEIRTELDLLLTCFGHFGDGNIHLSYTGPEGPLAEDRALMARERIFEAVSRMEGRIAAEHGLGLAKADHLARNLSPETIRLMERLKKAFDPLGILNPGKPFSPDQPTGHE